MQIKYKYKMNQQDDSKIVLRAASTVATVKLGRRLSSRYSATRGPYKERYNVQMIIANIKKEFAKDVLGGSGSSLWSECWTQMKMDI